MILSELFEGPQLCPECGGISFSNLILAEKKDACYYKVKASAKVWPSAYASGRLVQCRKKGAGNYGNKSEGLAENTAAGITKAFNSLGDPVYANLQRVALLAMQGRQSEAAGRLQTVIKGADPAVQKKITDAVNNIKPVTINGRVADSSSLDKSKQHNDWIINTFIPWVQSLLGQPGVAEDKWNPLTGGDYPTDYTSGDTTPSPAKFQAMLDYHGNNINVIRALDDLYRNAQSGSYYDSTVRQDRYLATIENSFGKKEKRYFPTKQEAYQYAKGYNSVVTSIEKIDREEDTSDLITLPVMLGIKDHKKKWMLQFPSEAYAQKWEFKHKNVAKILWDEGHALHTPEPEIKPEAEKDQEDDEPGKYGYDTQTGKPLKQGQQSSRPQQGARPQPTNRPQQYHTSQQVGYTKPSKYSKDDVTDVEVKEDDIDTVKRAVDNKGRTQQQWIQAVKSKFPDAKIIQSKMIDGPIQANLSDGRKIVWQKVEQDVAEGWSQKYKNSINCSHPKGFSQKAHCAGKKKHNESIEMEMTCPDCGMCETHSDHENLDEACWQGYHKEGNKKMFGKTYPNCVKNESMAENAVPQLSVPQLAAISDEALDLAYHYGRSTPGNTFGYQANLKSAAYAKQMIDQGVTDIEAISDAIHKGWNVTAQAFVQNPDQFDDTAKLATAGKLEAKLQQRAQLMKQNYAQLPEEEKEKDRVVARALLQAIRGEQGMAEGVRDLGYDAQSLITKLRRDVEEKRLQPTRQAVLMAARELAGDMDFAPELLVQQVLGRGMAEGNRKPEPPEADYGADYQDMVARVKHLARLGPLKTVWDPQKRVYKNVPVAVQPKK